ncbi:hypothetical protein Tco_1444456 [Tanacetum coccineum]
MLAPYIPAARVVYAVNTSIHDADLYDTSHFVSARIKMYLLMDDLCCSYDNSAACFEPADLRVDSAGQL